MIYLFTNFGGIRSPDSEIVFRVAESLADHCGFEVSSELGWKGHGIATGIDGKKYSLYAPLKSLMLAPFVYLGNKMASTGWYAQVTVPISFYCYRYAGDGVLAFIQKTPPPDPKPHALRYFVSFINPMIGALTVLAFFLIVNHMLKSQAAAFGAGILLAFGTLFWQYAGTFLNEQMATLLVLFSFYLLVLQDPAFDEKHRISGRSLFLAGLVLNLAFLTHITAVLFAPFFGIYTLYIGFQDRGRDSRFLLPVFWFSLGFCVLIPAWGYLNIIRFGSFFETGRTVSEAQAKIYGNGSMQSPLPGLYGQLISSGKGLLFFCPAILFGIAAWRDMHRRYFGLSLIVGLLVLFRIVFTSSMSFWHGGFCLGPRYLVMVIPFLILPVGFWLDNRIRKGLIRSYWIFVAAIIIFSIQQLYFALSEIFTFYHIIVGHYAARGIDIFRQNLLYTNWDLTPLWQLHKTARGPLWLRGIPLDNGTLWIVGSLLITVAFCWIFFVVWKNQQASVA